MKKNRLIDRNPLLPGLHARRAVAVPLIIFGAPEFFGPILR